MLRSGIKTDIDLALNYYDSAQPQLEVANAAKVSPLFAAANGNVFVRSQDLYISPGMR